jgi:eukaryotic-like serine/threonine-protein kinase
MLEGMTPDRRSQIAEILAVAIRRPENERASYLRDACGSDTALRAELETLLAEKDREQLTGPVPEFLPRPSDQEKTTVLLGDRGKVDNSPLDLSPLEPGSRIGPFQIESRIGAGGMGVVYRAHDTRLGRNVAIKVIRARTSNPLLQPAFLREAQLTSLLNHPGIVTIHDILFEREMTCIVMELIDGDPLHQLIPEEGLAIDRAISLASAIGDAIAVAHSAGVVHRDLKPANILIRADGQIKVLDFGLATISSLAAPDSATQAESIFGGSAVGTIGYMAPEQARGEAADQRADIFSFGVILYQMLTGTLPFKGVNAVALLHAVQSLDPDPLRQVKPAAAALEQVLRRALAKNPQDRYQTIRELLADLHTAAGRLVSPSASLDHPATPAIAVLPLINISPDPENEYICDGLAEELINGLTQIDSLRVVSRSSSFQCKGTTPDVRETGRRLGADLLVHGSLRRSGDNLRLTVQLSQTEDGFQLWSQRFDAQVRDLFALQDELTAAVLEKLRQQLGARFPGVGEAQKMPASEAYDLYLQGRFAFNRETPQDFRQALDLFRRSAAADPTFAPALIGIAESNMRLDWYGLVPATQSVPTVKANLDAALKLQPDSVAGLCNLAIVQAGWDWNWSAAGDTFARALASADGLASVHFHYGLDYLTPLARLDEALSHLHQALNLDPLSPIVRTAIGGCFYRMRRFGEAAETLRATLDSCTNFGHAYWSLGRVLLEIGEAEEALRHFQNAAAIMGNIPASQAELAYCYARMGQRDRTHLALQELQRRAQHEWVSPLHSALIYAGLGEQDAAIRRLEEAIDKRNRQVVWVNVDPRYDSLRNHPHFDRLIARLGLSPLHLDHRNQ